MKAVALRLDSLTFSRVYNAYEALLAANPGMGLLTATGDALFMLDRNVCTATITDGVPDMAFASCIDPRAWCESERCWVCDADSAETAAAIATPRFVPLPAATDEHWTEFFHGRRWWSFGPDEIARWDEEERCFHFHLYHRMVNPSAEAVIALIDATGGA